MLEEKVDLLTKEIVALRKAIEANGTAAAPAGKAAASEDKPKRAAAKKVEPEHDEDEVGSTMRAAARIDKPAVQKYIKSVKCADLAELLTKPELYDAAFDFANDIVNAPEDDV